MRRTWYAFVAAAAVGCGAESDVTQPPNVLAKKSAIPEYHVEIPPATLGGTISRGDAIIPRGWIAGFSREAGDATLRAALWRSGVISDLGTLGGPSSRVPWPGMNHSGMIVGISQTGELDTLGEAWACELGGFLPATNPRQVCKGFVWFDNVMRELPTFGGTHGFAAGVNNRGQAVGWAETVVHDPTCTGAQLLQFRAALWEPKKGTITELPPLPGDSASAATDINERGQAVGISGECDQGVGRRTALRSVLWENETPREIPNLGGITWHTPQSINNRGDVVGFSNPPGEDPVGTFIARGFLWKFGSDTAIDLGVLEGDGFSQAQVINNRGQIVGVSFGGPIGSRAFLFQNDTLMDLNDLAGPNFGPDARYQLRSARDITDSGLITGDVLDRNTGEIFAFVAIPRH